ncbi:MAG: FAD:protein FMN transferase [Bauldia sp.]|nr:FAD:protein FMN transferase [Bauldia sp.]MCW5716320.1 FAD:protein FMN transferase [Bauldia sp.]
MTLVDARPTPLGLSRRQALKVVAATAALPLGVLGLRAIGPTPQFHTWNGEVLGAVSSLTLWHSNANFARTTMQRMASEIGRLERIFSLYRPDSELRRLNADGMLEGASRDLRLVLTSARFIGLATGGAFDPTVQPLWDVYARHFASPGADPAGPSGFALDAARSLVGYRDIDTDGGAIRFARQGMQATLNGIAQGYITDRIADLLRNEGFQHVVVELGEARVLGDHPEGRPWRVGLRDRAGATDRMVDLSNGAVALHGGYGTVFDESGRNHHIFDPVTGRSAQTMLDVAVVSGRATDADAIGVGIYVAGEERASAILAQFPGTRAIITRRDGTTVTIG